MPRIVIGLLFVVSFDLLSQEPTIRDSIQNLNTDFHFQLTTVTEHKFSLSAPYTGPNSLTTNAETASTITATIFWGTKLWKGAALVINPEIAGGSGVSGAHGVADFTNGEAFRVGNPAPAIYAARLYYRQTLNLGGSKEYIGEGANKVYKTRSKNYLTFVAGKFSIADFFDNNSYSHDPRSQFLNWGLMSNGAWDYPANVRGYTWGAMMEYGSSFWKLRAATTMVAVEANGNVMDKNYNKANSNVVEMEKPIVVNNRRGFIRLLGFYTTARMGNYNLTIKKEPVNPDITTTRQYGRTKYGFGLNLEQELADGIGLFARASWNDGKNETWAFTEIDRSVSAGLSFDGSRWKRNNDVFGIGTVLSGISNDHRNYLAAGGYGFMIGDGQLTKYGRESVTELYYKANLFSDTFFLTLNYQLAHNPAYNRQRGPASFVAIRIHIAF